MRRSLRGLQKEGFRHVFILKSPEDIDAVEIERQPLWNNRKSDHGPFDIIGDVHGCADELTELLQLLGYAAGADGVWRAAHVDKDHAWHMARLSQVANTESPVLMATRNCMVDLSDPASEADATRWWEEMTERGGEGMVVKPLSFIARGRKGLVQPAIKVRGREYLRIIYGPEYTQPENLDRLRQRGLSLKRSLALREFALGVEGLERFVRREPLRRVHECVFGVLALESEPVDPRL
jgi:hypothetical protein